MAAQSSRVSARKSLAPVAAAATLLLALIATATSCPAQGTRTEPTPPEVEAPRAEWRFRFATLEESRKRLRSRDTFANALSPFDVDCRLGKTAGTLDEWLDYNAAQAVAWTEEDRKSLTPKLDTVHGLLREFDLPLPQEVVLVKTTGREESDAAYTRENAIFLPERVLRGGQLERLLIHEVFHVLSRNAPKLRVALYRIVGFDSCPPIQLPPDLARRKLTNPDAPLVDTTIRIKYEGNEVLSTPLLLASQDKFSPEDGKSFFQYLQFRLAVVDMVDGQKRIRRVNGAPVLFDPRKNDDYFRQIGRNTRYIIHPDEILADNFVLLARGDKVETQRILDEMRKLLKKPDRQ